jgi:hypothetical protein
MIGLVYRAIEALVRLEKKVDEILKILKKGDGVKIVVLETIGTAHQTCPLCSRSIRYEPFDGAIVRKCGCVPNVTEGEGNGY